MLASFSKAMQAKYETMGEYRKLLGQCLFWLYITGSFASFFIIAEQKNHSKEQPLIEVDTIGLKGSPTNVFKSFTPPQKGAGTMLTGDNVAAQLAGALAKKHLI